MTNHLSVSQVKKYTTNPSSRAWAYLLWIWDNFTKDAMIVWNAFHTFIETQSLKEGANYIKEHWEDIEDYESAVDKLSILVENYLDTPTPKAEQHEVPFDKDIWYWINFQGFVDWIVGDTILEYKSTSKISHKDDKPMQRQAHNNIEEYEFQIWVYMRATWLKKAKLIEVLNKDATIKRAGSLKKADIISLCKDFDKDDSKLTIQEIITKYQPKREFSQVIDYTRTDERDKEMDKKWGNIIREMKSLYKKYKKE